MTDTDSHVRRALRRTDAEAGTDAGAPGPTDQPPPRRRRRTRAIVVAAVVVVVAVAAAIAAFGIDFSSASPASTIRLPPATGKVTRMTLTETEKVDGTLGYGDPHAVTVRGTGTVTALPAAGATIQRGQPVFRRDDVAVPLFYGGLPFYRVLRSGVSGADVQELEQNLAALGYTGFTVDSDYTSQHRRRGPHVAGRPRREPDRRRSTRPRSCWPRPRSGSRCSRPASATRPPGRC